MKRNSEYAIYYDGNRARIRYLLDGRWVAEKLVGWLFKRWDGVSISNKGFIWPVGNHNYHDCIGTHDQCKAALASTGVGGTRFAYKISNGFTAAMHAIKEQGTKRIEDMREHGPTPARDNE